MIVRLGGISRYGACIMPKLLFPLLLLVAVVFVSGCSSGKKKPVNASRMYEGNAPTIHFNDEPEAAGGPLNTTAY